MIKINSRYQMSVVCDKCGKRHPTAKGLSGAAEWEDKEYICSKCQRLLTKHAPDVAPVTSAEPDSGLESVPAVESDTQPRG